uniref:Palmitoyltransferase n=1 Tax=Panagrolaimus sp. JU765 TaxID=591449 RepID=A0AC34RJD5_9BILA
MVDFERILEWEGPECECFYKYPLQVPVWGTLFLMWYSMYMIFVTFVSTFPMIIDFCLATVFNIVWFLAMTSLFWAAWMPPAKIPDRFKLPIEIAKMKKNDDYYFTLADYIQKFPTFPFRYCDETLSNGEEIRVARVCDQCKCFKPLRSHHCSTCKTCIPRMDHHCPVIGKCVHYHNHKGFLCFLFWASMVCLVGAIHLTPDMANFVLHVLSNPKLDDMAFTIPAVISLYGAANAIVFGIALIAFQYVSWAKLLDNETTLENSRKIYDFSRGSWIENIKTIMGPNPWTWFIPFATTEGDGFTYEFKVIQESSEN